jgi:hypothetical protein
MGNDKRKKQAVANLSYSFRDSLSANPVYWGALAKRQTGRESP